MARFLGFFLLFFFFIFHTLSFGLNLLNTSTATVGRINQNGIVTFGKICHLPHAGTALICTVIKRATGARAGRP